MNHNHKFEPKNLHKLDSPERRKMLPPEETLQKLGVAPGETVIDIGCGIGYFTLPLAKMVGKEGRVYAVDILAQMVDETASRCTEAGLNNVECLVSEENVLPVRDQAADVAWMANLFHELQDRKQFLTELKRILKPDGRVLAVDWQKFNTPVGPPEDHRVSLDEAREIFELAGFIIVNAASVGPAHWGLVAKIRL